MTDKMSLYFSVVLDFSSYHFIANVEIFYDCVVSNFAIFFFFKLFIILKHSDLPRQSSLPLSLKALLLFSVMCRSS